MGHDRQAGIERSLAVGGPAVPGVTVGAEEPQLLAAAVAVHQFLAIVGDFLAELIQRGHSLARPIEHRIEGLDVLGQAILNVQSLECLAEGRDLAVQRVVAAEVGRLARGREAAIVLGLVEFRLIIRVELRILGA